MSQNPPVAASAASASFSREDQQLIDLARKMVATPSLPGQEHDVSRLLAAQLQVLGYRDVTVDEAGNVVGWIGDGPPRLMFNGHIDHVPPAGMEDPYGATIVDGAQWGGEGPALRGRGSCDMKANVAAGAFAAAYLDRSQRLNGSYLFTADVQEETDSPEGIEALLARGLRADYGLSGESTSLDVSVGHRGKLQFDVVLQGRSSHASTPDAGVNAVYRATPLLRALEEEQRRLPSDPIFGGATITVTGISSEPAEDVAVVPSACTVRVDRRYIPGETPDGCERELAQLVERVTRDHPDGLTAEVRRVNVYPLMDTDPEHPLVGWGREAVAEVTGRSPRVMAWRFGVNATFMHAAGIPSIGIGPGNEDWAHTRDEHVPLGELVAASRVYARLIARVCR